MNGSHHRHPLAEKAEQNGDSAMLSDTILLPLTIRARKLTDRVLYSLLTHPLVTIAQPVQPIQNKIETKLKVMQTVITAINDEKR